MANVLVLKSLYSRFLILEYRRSMLRMKGVPKTSPERVMSSSSRRIHLRHSDESGMRSDDSSFPRSTIAV